MFSIVMNNLESFLFVFLRVSAIFFMIPFVGGKNVPIQMKLCFALLLGLVIAPTLAVDASMPTSAFALFFSIGRELLIGITIGLAARMVFASFEVAGQLAGIQMGFSVANVIDPATSGQLSVLAQLYNIVGILLFFTLDIHLVFISALKESFVIINPYAFSLSGGVIEGLITISSDLFKVALKIAAPISIAILLANLGMGILARTVPQLNVFVVGFPVTITLGLVIFIVTIPFVVSTITRVFGELSLNVMDLMRLAAT